MATIDSVKLPDNSTYDLADKTSGYAKKVAGATTDDLASLTATGDLADSGKKLSDLVLKADVKDVLNSTSMTDPLSANQGRVLEQQAEAGFNVLGAKNLGIPLEDMTYLNLSTSNNSDGSLTVTTNGLMCGGVSANWSSPFILKKGTYQVSFGLDTDETPSLTGFAVILKVYSTSYWLCTSGDSVASRKITLAADTEVVWGLYCESGTVVATQTAYPMIRPASIVDPTFVPYAPTNRELMSYKANGKVGAKNLFDDDDYLSLDNMGKSGHTFTSNNTDTRNYFDFTIDTWDGTTYIQALVNKTVASTGHYEYSVNIPNNANRLRVLHNGSQRNIGVMFNTSVTGACIISLDITGVDPTTVGGLSFKDIMIRIAEDTDPNYQPYAKTNKQLTDAVKTLDKIKYYESSGASITVPLQVGMLMFVSRASDAVKGIFMVDVTGNINELITASFCTATISGDTITIANTVGVALNVTVIYSL